MRTNEPPCSRCGKKKYLIFCKICQDEYCTDCANQNELETMICDKCREAAFADGEVMDDYI